MKSYTFGSPEGVQAVINSLPERYSMDLNADDMEALVMALAHPFDTDDCRERPDHVRNSGDCPDTCWRWRAESLLGSIAETVNVDWV